MTSYRHPADIEKIINSIIDGDFSGDINTLKIDNGDHVLHQIFMADDGEIEYSMLLLTVLPHLNGLGADLTIRDHKGMTPIDWLWQTSRFFNEDFVLTRKYLGNDIPRPQPHIVNYLGEVYERGTCTKCDFNYVSFSQLTRHITHHHKTYICGRCNKLISGGYIGLDNHGKSVHDCCGDDCIKYMCKLCKEEIIGRWEFVSHLAKQHNIHSRWADYME